MSATTLSPRAPSSTSVPIRCERISAVAGQTPCSPTFHDTNNPNSLLRCVLPQGNALDRPVCSHLVCSEVVFRLSCFKATGSSPLVLLLRCRFISVLPASASFLSAASDASPAKTDRIRRISNPSFVHRVDWALSQTQVRPLPAEVARSARTKISKRRPRVICVLLAATGFRVVQPRLPPVPCAHQVCEWSSPADIGAGTSTLASAVAGATSVFSSCSPCAGGKYQGNSGQSSCTDCEIGTYSPDPQVCSLFDVVVTISTGWSCWCGPML